MLDVKDIMQKDLHVALLRDNYIHGMKYSYEEYLIDFLNSSKIKFDKGNKEFKRISSQAHGECDATNDIYEICRYESYRWKKELFFRNCENGRRDFLHAARKSNRTYRIL